MPRLVVCAALLAAIPLIAPAQSAGDPGLDPARPAAASAQDLPPPTAEEQQMLLAVRKQWKAQGLGDMTPEQEAAMLRKFRLMRGSMATNLTMMRMAAGAGATQPVVPAAAPATVAAPPSASPASPVVAKSDVARPTTFSDPFGGFLVNGRSWVDPAGSPFAFPVGGGRYAYQMFAGNRATGAMTYMVRSGQPDHYLVRSTNANSLAAPVTIGTLEQTRANGWEFTPPEGGTVAGQSIFMLDDGLLMARIDNVFRYRPGSALQTIPLPPGFALFGYQRGDVGTTHVVAIFRARGANHSVFHEIKSIAGKSEDSDLALLNIDTGQLFPLKRTVDDTLLNKMFDGYGNPISSYYLWSIYWYSTPDGPIAVAFEHDAGEVVAIDLTNDHRVTLFSRSLGITEFHPTQYPDGHVSVEASWMFKKHEAPDVGAILAGKAPVPTS
ncbi:MAG: hypothetical protein JSS45_01360 [Proteobacteria bacterium]|nr:hypothetical protein [Pseudomonadota bacterium]